MDEILRLLDQLQSPRDQAACDLLQAAYALLEQQLEQVKQNQILFQTVVDAAKAFVTSGGVQ